MADQYSSEKKTLGELLSLTSPNIVVPEWQRNYSWERAQIESFWSDLIAFSELYPGENLADQEYFLGSVVLVKGGTKHELLDGQQRLATTTVLLAAIRDELAVYNKDAATRLVHSYITDYDDATGQREYKLTLNRYDSAFFRAEIQDEGNPPNPTLRSHRLIREAHEFFREHLGQRNAALGGGKPAFEWALRLRRVLTDHVSVVAVGSTDEDNAAAVFETLNDRGIGLSTPDLLRNLLLRRAKNDDARNRIIEHWGIILGIDDEAAVDEYLRHYWLSHHGDVKTRSLYRTIKDWVQSEDVDSLDFSRDLAETAQVYRDLVTARVEDPDSRRLLEGIAALGAKSLRPALLSAFAKGDDASRRDFIRSLCALFVRYNVIENRESTVLEKTVYATAKSLRESGDFDKAAAALRALNPSDDQFRNSFATASVGRRASQRYLLRELEHHLRETEEVAVEAPDRVHVEHIYPQTPPEGSRWSNHDAMIDRLGNLTLLAKRLNISIQNSDFTTKKAEAYAKSDLLLTKQLLKYQAWDEAVLSKRQLALAEIAPTIWVV